MTSPHASGSLVPDPRHVVHGLAKIGLALRHRTWRAAGERGLTPTQGQVLAFLRYRAPGGARLGEVAEALAVSAPTASDAVAALATKRLVRKERTGCDGRAVRIVLTPRGRREAERAAAWPDFLSAAVETLPRGERAVFLRGLVRIVRELQERGEVPVSRMCTTCRYFRPNVHADAARPHHCAFVDAPFGDGALRLDCDDHEPADAGLASENWALFVKETR